MSEYLNPDFDSRTRNIQPQTQVYRAAYRSPIQSHTMNLFRNSVVEDVNYLYDKLDSIGNDFKSRLDEIYLDDSIQISEDTVVATLFAYANELQYLREEINNLIAPSASVELLGDLDGGSAFDSGSLVDGGDAFSSYTQGSDGGPA